VTELVGHQLRDRAHGHLAESSAEPCDAEASGELCWGMGRGCDDEADAADCISKDEDDTSAEEVAVGTGEDESDRVTRSVGRNCMLSALPVSTKEQGATHSTRHKTADHRIAPRVCLA
jgi:hypothetical protein